MNDQKIQMSLSISKKLLDKIEKDIEGKDRSEKIVKVVTKGYELLTEKQEWTSS